MDEGGEENDEDTELMEGRLALGDGWRLRPFCMTSRFEDDD